MRKFGMLVACVWMFHASILSAQSGESSVQKGAGSHIVTGTLEELDLSRLKGMIKTDLGKPVFFEVSKPELFKGLSVGERVTVQVDDRGRATKVIDTPIPELKQPLN